ncbi:MAG TPA: ABC transporter ATP-binding protein [Rubrobacteraceae bacterium]|nr:ABC transporter ATP-binding protein [Rubrobacteraceae bacterium]
MTAAPEVPVREIFRRFWPYARPYRRWIPVVVLLVALGSAIEAATIWIYKVLIDDVLMPKEFGLLFWVALAYLGLTLLDGIISFCDEYLSAWVGERFLLSLRTEFFRHLQGLPPHFFDRRKLGDLISRLSDDIDVVEELMLSGVTSALSYTFQLVFFAGALFYLDWRLALLSLFVVPLFWTAARYFAGLMQRVVREERRRAGSIGAVAEESLSNATLVQAYDRQEEQVARFHRENLGSFAAEMAATRLGALFSPLINLIQLAGLLVVVVFGAWQVSRGVLSIGGLLVFMVYLSQLYGPVQGLSSLLNVVYAASAGAERIIEFLDQHPSVREREDAFDLGRAQGKIAFENVSFVYPQTEGASLSNVSFEVGPGEVLALVGESGAGKSTIAKLLLRFYDPTEGQILFDGHDLKALSLRSLRQNVAVLLQEGLLFDGTVYENIAYGKRGATREEIVRAATAADAHEFIEALPDGYDTVVGQRGRLLSGGQRQRIAIARAMVRDAPVLILDEPTTGLDGESARRILEPLRRLAEGRTTIIISHDLSEMPQATHTATLKDGYVASSSRAAGRAR